MIKATPIVLPFFFLFSLPCFSGESYYSYGAGKERIDGAGTIHYYVNDHLDSARVILNEDQSVEWSSDYQPYGQEVNVQAMGAMEDKTFSGKEHDATGLYYFGARYYDPATARFYSIDPARQDESPYVYAGNNPLVRIDPTGGSWQGTWDWTRNAVEHLLVAAGYWAFLPLALLNAEEYGDYTALKEIGENVAIDVATAGTVKYGGKYVAKPALRWMGTKAAYASSGKWGTIRGMMPDEIVTMMDVFLDNPKYKYYTLKEFAEFLGFKYHALTHGFRRNPGLAEAWENARAARGLSKIVGSSDVKIKAADFLEVISKTGFVTKHNMIIFLGNYYREIAQKVGSSRTTKALITRQEIRAKYEARLQKFGIPYSLAELEKLYSRNRVASSIKKYSGIIPEDQMYKKKGR